MPTPEMGRSDDGRPVSACMVLQGTLGGRGTVRDNRRPVERLPRLSSAEQLIDNGSLHIMNKEKAVQLLRKSIQLKHYSYRTEQG